MTHTFSVVRVVYFFSRFGKIRRKKSKKTVFYKIKS